MKLNLCGLGIGLGIGLILALVFCYGLSRWLARVEGGLKGYLWWEAVPFLLIMTLFGVTACLNWPYAVKLLTVRSHVPSQGFFDACLGPILLAIGMILAVLAGGLLFCLRLLAPYMIGARWRWYAWVPGVILSTGIFMLTLGSAYVIFLGPAALTMTDQMEHVPDTHQ